MAQWDPKSTTYSPGESMVSDLSIYSRVSLILSRMVAFTATKVEKLANLSLTNPIAWMGQETLDVITKQRAMSFSAKQSFQATKQC